MKTLRLDRIIDTYLKRLVAQQRQHKLAGRSTAVGVSCQLVVWVFPRS